MLIEERKGEWEKRGGGDSNFRISSSPPLPITQSPPLLF